MRLDAGRFSERVRFERRVYADDGFGNSRGDWKRVAVVWGIWMPEFGREAIKADRLESSIRGVLTVRWTKDFSVVSSDRALMGEEIYQIRSIVPRRSEGIIELVLEGGVAT